MIPSELIASLIFCIVLVITGYLIVRSNERRADKRENDKLFSDTPTYVIRPRKDISKLDK